MKPPTDYSIYLIEYARASGHPVGGILYGHYNAGVMALPYCYCVLESADRLVVVDTGYRDSGSGHALGAAAGVQTWMGPDEALATLGLSPADVTVGLLTHAHFDHMGNLDAFPNATFYLQRRELDAALAALDAPERLGWLKAALSPDDVHRAQQLAATGRLRLVDGRTDDALPQISLVPAFDTHSPGSQAIVIFNASDGPWLLAGDVIPSRANLTGSRRGGQLQYVPPGFATGSQSEAVRAMEALMALVGYDARRVVPQHDADVWSEMVCTTLPNGLHIAEVSLRPGARTRIGEHGSDRASDKEARRQAGRATRDGV